MGFDRKVISGRGFLITVKKYSREAFIYPLLLIITIGFFILEWKYESVIFVIPPFEAAFYTGDIKGEHVTYNGIEFLMAFGAFY